MRKPFAALAIIGFLPLPLSARTLPPLPEPVSVDGEVSRNYPFEQSELGSIWADRVVCLDERMRCGVCRCFCVAAVMDLRHAMESHARHGAR